MVQRMQALVQKLRSASERERQKQTHLVPDRMTTLASLIPLGMRSLMTSRMIRDPMKVYSADTQQIHTPNDCEHHTKQKRTTEKKILKDQKKLTSISISIPLFFLALSWPWRRRRGRPGATPYITGAVRDESAEKERITFVILKAIKTNSPLLHENHLFCHI